VRALLTGDGVRVTVKITLDISPLAWAGEYGVTETAVRQDVKDYVSQMIHAQLTELGVLATSPTRPINPQR
jgi:hypothetical protein